MGRALPKRFFGNVNTNDSGDNKDTFNNASGEGIGGQGIDSINWSNLGLFRGNDAINEPLVGLDLPAPTLPGGVQATWTVIFEVASVSTGAGKAGLVVGATYTYADGGSPTITVANVSGTNATFTTTGGSGVTYGSLPTDTTGVNITKVSGSGPSTFLTDINFKVKSVTINDKGSGYIGTETFTVTTYSATTGAAPAGTIVLTTDDGIPYDPEAFPAIIAYAYVTSANQIADINKQESTRQYKVTTAEGTRKCVLKAGTPNAVGEMSINATDSAGGTYWVTKMTHNLVTLTPNTGSQFVTDTRAQWVLDTPVNGVSVKLDNA
jgi:hypothetical protein